MDYKKRLGIDNITIRRDYFHMRECGVMEKDIARLIGVCRTTLFMIRKQGTEELEAAETTLRNSELKPPKKKSTGPYIHR